MATVVSEYSPKHFMVTLWKQHVGDDDKERLKAMLRNDWSTELHRSA